MFDIFYQNFKASDPAISKLFRDSEMEKQKEMLKQSLSMAIIFPQNNVVAKRAMAKLKLMHGPEGMNVEPSYYQYWLDSLISTLKVCDPYFDANLERMWREVMGKTIHYFLDNK